ncbi:MAG: putative tricarboxylic transport rane protein [Pseudonocardia sp.]
MYLGNVMLLLINIFCIPVFASVARVPFRVLAPVIVVLCVIGTYSVNGSIVEVGIMLACGVLGFFMRRFGMSPAALVIALVLGPLTEETLHQTMIISGGDPTIFVQRTTSAVLLVVIAVLVLVPVVLPRPRVAVAAWLAAVGQRRSADGADPAETTETTGHR